MAGTPDAAPRSPLPLPAAAPLNTRAPVDRVEALKALGMYRKSVKHKPVAVGYSPTTTFWPVMFPYAAGQQLTKLSRGVSGEWQTILTSVSTTSLAGGRLTGSQGRNLIRIVEELRKRCYLQVDANGRPVKAREHFLATVEGETESGDGIYSFAAECGLSRATFYRALQHPLAHFFVRTQKVQRVEAGGASRRNVATLFSVALYEPLVPADLTQHFWAEPVETQEVFTVPDYPSQDERNRERPLTTQKQNAACGKLTSALGGAFSAASGGGDVRQWLDHAALISRAGNTKTPVVLADGVLEGCIDRLRQRDPALWEFAVQIAIHHDLGDTQAVAAVGYYKALVHLGVPVVRYWVQRIEKWRLKGQPIQTPGKLLMHHLNREARKALGFNISDLGTEQGEVLA